MKVRDLIAALRQCDEDSIVVMASDSEGNSYSPLAGVSTAKYRAETTWSGEVGLAELTDADREQGYSEEDVIEDGEFAVVLEPTN